MLIYFYKLSFGAHLLRISLVKLRQTRKYLQSIFIASFLPVSHCRLPVAFSYSFSHLHHHFLLFFYYTFSFHKLLPHCCLTLYFQLTAGLTNMWKCIIAPHNSCTPLYRHIYVCIYMCTLFLPPSPIFFFFFVGIILRYFTFSSSVSHMSSSYAYYLP